MADHPGPGRWLDWPTRLPLCFETETAQDCHVFVGRVFAGRGKGPVHPLIVCSSFGTGSPSHPSILELDPASTKSPCRTPGPGPRGSPGILRLVKIVRAQPRLSEAPGKLGTKNTRPGVASRHRPSSRASSASLMLYDPTISLPLACSSAHAHNVGDASHDCWGLEDRGVL